MIIDKNDEIMEQEENIALYDSYWITKTNFSFLMAGTKYYCTCIVLSVNKG